MLPFEAFGDDPIVLFVARQCAVLNEAVEEGSSNPPLVGIVEDAWGRADFVAMVVLYETTRESFRCRSNGVWEILGSDCFADHTQYTKVARVQVESLCREKGNSRKGKNGSRLNHGNVQNHDELRGKRVWGRLVY